MNRLAPLAILICFLLTSCNNNANIHSSIEKEYNSTCRIITSSSVSTGVLLNTGYVLTAKHSVDINSNDIIEANERNVSIVFANGEKDTSSIAFISSGYDYVILLPKKKKVSNITIAKDTPIIGDEVFTIGMMHGDTQQITKGFVCKRSLSGRPKISCYVYFGNSGGGIFNGEDEVIGIITSVRGIKRAFCPLVCIDIVNCLSSYVSVDEMRAELSAKNLLEMIDIEPSYKLTHMRKQILLLTSQILLVLCCVGAARRYLFS